MLYRLLRWITRVALRWFYRDVEVNGLERIPAEGPVLLAVNHPNALVDALVVGDILPRELVLTAKATLFEHPVLRALFRWVKIIPLRRVTDETKRNPAAAPDAARNVDAFRAILDALADGEAVLIFPEGRSHNEPSLAPLRTGLARIALQARHERGIRGISIVPVGLTFERKWRPRTRIFVHVGDPIALDEWHPRDVSAPVDSLMLDVDTALRAATLNFASPEDAERVLGLSRLLAGAFDRARPLGSPDAPLASEVEIVRRIVAVERSLPPSAAERASHFLARLEALRQELLTRRITVSDVAISPALVPGARFGVREGMLVALTGPVALWGRVNHWIPLTLARWIARRQSKSPEDPAMYTLVLGLALVIIAY
ncbi:MAG TPA: lysophospholipid acyltransferase family protein, partial [Gemmatimonadaceae bacterium]|nr:lysophospholipid acyltransferase family protein [Gemmatimonadaceae bacterium]